MSMPITLYVSTLCQQVRLHKVYMQFENIVMATESRILGDYNQGIDYKDHKLCFTHIEDQRKHELKSVTSTCQLGPSPRASSPSFCRDHFVLT